MKNGRSKNSYGSEWAISDTPAGPAPMLGSVGMIRARLRAEGVRCFANDAIGAHLSESDIQAIESEVEQRVHELLDALLIDVEADHNSRDTPQRMARMFVRDVFAGRYSPRPSVMEFPNEKQMTELYVVGPITVRINLRPSSVPDLWKGMVRPSSK